MARLSAMTFIVPDYGVSIIPIKCKKLGRCLLIFSFYKLNPGLNHLPLGSWLLKEEYVCLR